MMKLFSQLSTDISIHALLAESDRCCPCAIIAPAISIHALLAESDKVVVNKSHKPHGFLSTLSLRRATNQGKIDQQC